MEDDWGDSTWDETDCDTCGTPSSGDEEDDW